MESKPSSSSKVTIEYSDPSGVFPLISDHLRRRFPLRNLHWTSASRPLRSINSLHVELLPDNRRVSRGSDDPMQRNPNGAKERRHQIPGLRQTPYVKIYLLRCKDSETYKATSRKLLREWVKEHTPPSQSSSLINKADNHDAFEWLIVHVVLQNDDGSKGLRLSGSSKGESVVEKASSGSRWSTRGSTLISKIRSDFNTTSKAAVDRVAQIEIGGNTNSPTDSPLQEIEDDTGFNDLTSKLKYLILASFDQRVSQYEEDIREKDSQRSLPGWNFNTFFLLKEGLARGFESVGLVEDALTSYHELSASLNAIVAGQLTRTSSGGATNNFCEFTDDLLKALKQAINAAKASSQILGTRKNADMPREGDEDSLGDLGATVLDTNRKPYRELILANNISAFDFLCYVFARQVSLLLRLANSAPLKEISPFDEAFDEDSYKRETRKPISKSDQPELNLLILADVCKQAIGSITSISRVIRDDLYTAMNNMAQASQGQDMTLDKTTWIIENLVASWTFSACECILEKTYAPSILTQSEPLLRLFKESSSIHRRHQDRPPDDKNAVNRENLPRRTSFLQSSNSLPLRTASSQKPPAVNLLDSMRQLPSRPSQTGSQNLAAQRADLSNLAKGVLGNLGLRHGGWGLFARVQWLESEMEEIPLEDPLTDAPLDPMRAYKGTQALTRCGIQNPVLNTALSSENKFYAAYEELIASVLALFVLGDRPKSAEAMAADIGMIRYQLGDYAAAASYFTQLAEVYAKDSWTHLEMNMLNMYAHCLKELNQREEYVQAGLKIVGKLVLEDCTTSRIQGPLERKASSLTDLISASAAIEKQLTVPMQDFFGNIYVDPYARPYDDHDGFRLQLQFTNLTSDVIKAQQVQIKLVNTEDHHSELLLVADNVTSIQSGVVSILVGTQIMRPGWYVLDEILIRSENIIFTHDPVASHASALFAEPSNRLPSADGIVGQIRVLVWPQAHSLEVRLTHHNEIRLEQPRSITVEISAGWNDISQGKLLLRAGSAGLRIHTADASIFSGDSSLLDQSQIGSICFGKILANSTIVVRVPYALESDLREITVKIEVSYNTAKGNFIYAYTPRIPILLPLGVSVQDIFQRDALFSRFTISTVDAIPVRVTRCHLQSSVDYEVSSPSLTHGALDVFARQPLSLISRLYRRPPSIAKAVGINSKPKRLLLEVEYRCLDQEIVRSAELCLLESLQAANLERFSRLLIPSLLRDLSSRFTVQELEISGLLREICIHRILDSHWDTISLGIEPIQRDVIAKWLVRWKQENTTVTIQNNDRASKLQYLFVPVDIPHMDVIHTVSLDLHRVTMVRPATEVRTVAIGQAIPAELTIEHTRKWSDPNSTLDEALEFYFDVHASPDTWIIGGQRKAHFSAREHEPQSFPLLLIPQKTGHLLYPSIDVVSTTPTVSSHHHNHHHHQKTTTEAQGDPRTPPTSEIDYKNQGDTILVVPNLSSTTVGIDLENMVGGSVVESITSKNE